MTGFVAVTSPQRGYYLPLITGSAFHFRVPASSAEGLAPSYIINTAMQLVDSH